MINISLLKNFGAVEKQVKRGAFLFREGDEAVFYYQIVSGVIKMNNYTDDGHETIQGVFNANQSFGEPALLGEFAYPANAEAVEAARVICLERRSFLDLLAKNAPVSLDLLKVLSKRLYFKALLSKEIKGHEAEHQLLSLMGYLKEQSGSKGKFLVEMTRQTMANLTGLRVETVIRSLKKLELEGRILNEKGKIYI